jgi:hypothetical protein
MRHHARTASTSSRGERQATRNLNEQQLQGGVIQTSAGGGGMNTGQPNMGNNPSPDTTAQPGASMQPNANAPSNATYTQPQGSQGMQPGNAGYQQPQNTTGEPTPGYSSAPGAAGPAGSQGNPVTPTDQNATPPPKDTSNPGS